MKPRKASRDRACRPMIGRRPATTILLAMTAAVLAACQTTPAPRKAEPVWRIEPLLSVRSAGETAAGYYSLGRHFQGQNRLHLALDAYRRAIAIDPRYAEAHNAIGAIAGVQGRFDAAIRAFRAGLEIAPSAPHILNNLGHALTLAGRPTEALPFLRQAADLDPANAGSRANLALALSRIEPAERTRGEPLVAEVATRGDRGPREVDLRDGALTEPASGSLEALDETYRLEIANGNGVSGAAARLGAMLERDGAPRARLTNQRPFDRKATVIYVAEGFEAQAHRLAARLGNPGARVELSRLTRADVRIVLGRDVLPMLAANGKRPVALAFAGARAAVVPSAKP